MGIDKTLTLRSLLRILKKTGVDMSLAVGLFSDSDGAFDVETEVTFYEFIHACTYFALHEQQQQQQQLTQQQQQATAHQSQLQQLQMQQQMLFQQLQQNKQPSPHSAPPTAPEAPPPPFMDRLILGDEY